MSTFESEELEWGRRTGLREEIVKHTATPDLNGGGGQQEGVIAAADVARSRGRQRRRVKLVTSYGGIYPRPAARTRSAELLCEESGAKRDGPVGGGKELRCHGTATTPAQGFQCLMRARRPLTTLTPSRRPHPGPIDAARVEIGLSPSV